MSLDHFLLTFLATLFWSFFLHILKHFDAISSKDIQFHHLFHWGICYNFPLKIAGSSCLLEEKAENLILKAEAIGMKTDSCCAFLEAQGSPLKKIWTKKTSSTCLFLDCILLYGLSLLHPYCYPSISEIVVDINKLQNVYCCSRLCIVCVVFGQ